MGHVLPPARSRGRGDFYSIILQISSCLLWGLSCKILPFQRGFMSSPSEAPLGRTVRSPLLASSGGRIFSPFISPFFYFFTFQGAFRTKSIQRLCHSSTLVQNCQVNSGSGENTGILHNTIFRFLAYITWLPPGYPTVSRRTFKTSAKLSFQKFISFMNKRKPYFILFM